MKLILYRKLAKWAMWFLSLRFLLLGQNNFQPGSHDSYFHAETKSLRDYSWDVSIALPAGPWLFLAQ